MLFSFGIIFILSLIFSYLFEKIKIPKIIAMIILGIVLGPYVLNLIDKSILSISAEIRQLALIIILLRAGFTLNLADLKKVGRQSILMSFVPACFEILAFYLFATHLLNIDKISALIMGAVIGAVSPAIVVPRMIKLITLNYGVKKSIPQMILASSSCDDIFVIVLFTSFLGMAQTKSFSFSSLLSIPISITFGVILGIIFGFVLYKLFSHFKNIDNTVKVIIILSSSFLLVGIENLLKDYIAISSILAIVSTACMIKSKISTDITLNISTSFSKLWTIAEILLFVLVGATVDINYLLNAGILSVIMIFISLLFRSIGVIICLIKTPLTKKEKIFCIVSYLPKATVQAGIGSIPLSMGIENGNIILTMAVLSIIISAPLGSFLIDNTYKKLLKKDDV